MYIALASSIWKLGKETLSFFVFVFFIPNPTAQANLKHHHSKHLILPSRTPAPSRILPSHFHTLIYFVQELCFDGSYMYIERMLSSRHSTQHFHYYPIPIRYTSFSRYLHHHYYFPFKHSKRRKGKTHTHIY